MPQLDEIISRLTAMPEDKRQKVIETALTAKKSLNLKWIPNPGPQTEAYICEADQVLYGGEVGGGKTDILLGKALQKHKRSLILRRHNNEVEFLVERTEEIVGSRDGYNGQKGRWHFDNRLIQYGGCQYPGDEKKYKGEPKDFIGIDEATEFLEAQVDYMIGWLRSQDETQHCQLLLATNPPTTADGEWVIRWFAPWIDKTHPMYPQPSGKILYFVRDGDHFRWMETRDPVEIDGRMVTPMSRTFIRSGLKDNPFYINTDYADRLENLPEELRRRYAEGDFMAGVGDAEFQVIPTQWVIEAQNRWTERPPEGLAMTAMALDPAGGGRDEEIIAMRYGGWYAPLVSNQGEETSDGSITAANVVRHRRDKCPVIVDVGGGYGGSVILRLKDNSIECDKFDGRTATGLGKTRDGQLEFANMRAKAWWRLREELDPNQEGGSAIALPPDPELRADLCSPTWKLTARGILLESKEEIKKRLGRSPGKGDAVVMALEPGQRVAIRKYINRPKVVMGYQNRR